MKEIQHDRAGVVGFFGSNNLANVLRDSKYYQWFVSKLNKVKSKKKEKRTAESKQRLVEKDIQTLNKMSDLIENNIEELLTDYPKIETWNSFESVRGGGKKYKRKNKKTKKKFKIKRKKKSKKKYKKHIKKTKKMKKVFKKSMTKKTK